MASNDRWSYIMSLITRLMIRVRHSIQSVYGMETVVLSMSVSQMSTRSIDGRIVPVTLR
jgi:hypothetical protein